MSVFFSGGEHCCTVIFVDFKSLKAFLPTTVNKTVFLLFRFAEY